MRCLARIWVMAPAAGVVYSIHAFNTHIWLQACHTLSVAHSTDCCPASVPRTHLCVEGTAWQASHSPHARAGPRDGVHIQRVQGQLQPAAPLPQVGAH